ncbi:MAG: hypothetical protein CK429_02230 [Mycobacterium sp.]|jgi:hypothetical protein|uniref:Uncharacterized protein n=2 Tax=Mycobacterium gordonae TaxID=1778 RepID=A0A1A6BLE1_MYCGO|nr:hypothetical protein [Mycobacterium sp.]OBS03111.1 hypothetical protein A9W98_11295 [Mycobacterium gordonae]ODR23024.1 hypothetical protein BHQ23_06445 [Mycobacterium gordonae]ORV92241.1 hypothetical protein AWC08_19705 [Mycobacterium gordonae]PJE18839.1 MAG: hypothetical protein CK429_02230 [Mycobacterium sp.]
MTEVTNRGGSRATGLTMTDQRRVMHNREKICMPVNEAVSRPGGGRMVGDRMAANQPAMGMPALAKSEPGSGAIRGKTAAADKSDEQMDSC